MTLNRSRGRASVGRDIHSRSRSQGGRGSAKLVAVRHMHEIQQHLVRPHVRTQRGVHARIREPEDEDYTLPEFGVRIAYRPTDSLPYSGPVLVQVTDLSSISIPTLPQVRFD